MNTQYKKSWQSVGFISLFSWVLALVFQLTLSSVAHAENLIGPGESFVVEHSTSVVLVPEKPEHGTLSVVNDQSGDKKNLIYIAPDTANNLLIKLKYKRGDKDIEKTVQIAPGSKTFGSPELYDTSFKAIFILFVLAVIVESGLALLFRWRPYLRNINTAAINSVVAFSFSLLLVISFKLDLVTKLMNAYSIPSFANGPLGYILTAMVVAGGSHGVNKLLRSLGMRSIGPPPEVMGPKDDTKAWLSVTLDRDLAVGPVDVLYGEKDKEAVIGTITGDPIDNWFKNLFWRGTGRYPQNGGHTIPVVANKTQQIILSGTKADGTKFSSTTEQTWGPNAIGPRAIIDVTMKL